MELAQASNLAPAVKLDAKRLAVAHCLARGMETPEISKTTGVPERTIRDWKNLPEVQTKAYELQLALNGELVNVVADEIVNALHYLIDRIGGALPEIPVRSVGDIQTAIDIAESLAELRSKLIGKQQQIQPTSLNQMNLQINTGGAPVDMDKIIDRVQVDDERKAELRVQHAEMMEQLVEAQASGDDDEDA